jgi:hypothetical protein
VIGTRYDVMPIPPVEAATRTFPAGPVCIGVEFRHVDAAVIDAAYGGITVRQAGEDTPQPPILNDRGVSLHVCDAASGAEYLRFDIFGDDPHYHYIRPGEYQLVVPYDRAASGDMLAWTLRTLSTRIGPMLAFAGGEDLARRVSPAEVDAALPAVASAIEAAGALA